MLTSQFVCSPSGSLVSIPLTDSLTKENLQQHTKALAGEGQVAANKGN